MALDQRALFLSTVADDAIVLESSTSSDSMPPAYILEQAPGDRWRSRINTGAYVELDLGTSLTIDTVAPLWTNASNSATWRIRLASSKANLTDSPIYDSRNYNLSDIDHWPNKAEVDLSGWRRTHAFYYLGDDVPSGVTARYLRIDVSDVSNPDGYYEMGRLLAGVKFQPTINIQYGARLPFFNEEAVRKVTEGGKKRTVAQPRTREPSALLVFKDLDELMENMFELSRVKGTSEDLLYIYDPSSKWLHHFMVHCVMSQPMESTQPEFGLYDVAFALEELR